MKNILFLLLLSPLSLLAQRDFDYTIYTTKANRVFAGDTIELTLNVKFEKEANILKRVSLTNTGEAVQYQLQFIGASTLTGCSVFMYQIVGDEKLKWVFINPMEPSVMFKSNDSFASYY